MDKNLVYETVGKAIKSASGKGFAEAQKIIAEAVLALEGTAPVEVFAITESATEPEIPPSIVRPTSRLAALKPVVAPPPRSVVKQLWTTEQIRILIEQETPEILIFIPENTEKEAHLNRIITVDTNTPPAVQLSYRPNSSDPDIPYPKAMLFTTDESWDWPGMVEKMTKDAARMYRARIAPIRTTKVSTGGKVIFSNKAEV